MKFFRNKTNTVLGLYDIGINIGPGQVIMLTETQVERSGHLNVFLGKGLLEQVDKKAIDIKFTVAKPPDVVLPAGVVPEKREVLSDGVVVSSGMGQIVVEGQLPGTGTVKPMDQVIKEGTDKLQKDFAEQVKNATLPPEPGTVTQVPDDLKEWFALRHQEKKTKLLSITDPGELTRIAQYDTNPKIQKLIDQRLQELKGE